MLLPGICGIINSLLRMINGNRPCRGILPVSHLLMPCLDDCLMRLNKVNIKKIPSLFSLAIMAGIWVKKNIGENLLYGKKLQEFLLSLLLLVLQNQILF